MVELRLPLGFAIEADALYSQANLSSVIEAAGSLVSAATDANSWEFPVVLKKKFGGADAIAASVRPYVEAGASFRRFTGLKDLPAFVTGSGGTSTPTTRGSLLAVVWKYAHCLCACHRKSGSRAGVPITFWEASRTSGRRIGTRASSWWASRSET